MILNIHSSPSRVSRQYSSMRNLLITGTGRCGTTWARQALINMGIPCTHERKEATACPGVALEDHADSSFFAAPTADQYEHVVHIVRQPLRIIRSFMVLYWWKNRSTENQGLERFLAEHVQLTEPKPLLQTAEYVMKWNALIDQKAPNAPIFRVHEGIRSLANVLKSVGVHVPNPDAPNPPVLNSKRELRRRGRVKYSSLEHLEEPIKQLTIQHGYTPTKKDEFF